MRIKFLDNYLDKHTRTSEVVVNGFDQYNKPVTETMIVHGMDRRAKFLYHIMYWLHLVERFPTVSKTQFSKIV